MKLMQLLIFILPLFWAGCATSTYEALQKVKPGMDKSDVIETVGSPTRTQRFKGKDIWTFVFYDKNDQPSGMDVTFKDGVVISKRMSKLDPANDSYARKSESDREFREYQKMIKKKRSRSDLEEL